MNKTIENGNINGLDENTAKNEKGVPGGIIDRGNPTSCAASFLALDKKSKKRFSAEDIQRAKVKQAAKQAERAALREVTIHGRKFDLRKEPAYRRNYLIRLSELQTSPLKAIKLKCLECSAYSAVEAQQCHAPDCALWVFLQNRKAKNSGEEE